MNIYRLCDSTSGIMPDSGNIKKADFDLGNKSAVGGHSGRDNSWPRKDLGIPPSTGRLPTWGRARGGRGESRRIIADNGGSVVRNN